MKSPTDELRNELNNSVGILLATKEYLGEETKLLVDVSIPGFPSVMKGSKELILENLTRVEMVLRRWIDQIPL